MKLRIYPTVFFTILTCVLSIYGKPKFERCLDTFSVALPYSTIDSLTNIWANKINGKIQENNCAGCDTLPPYYITGTLRTGMFLRVDTSNLELSKVTLIHIWNKDYRKIALYRIPNVSYTLKQELGLPAEVGTKIEPKTNGAFLGLTLLNSGLGMYYASSNSPFSKENIAFTVLYGLMDAALTTGLFIDNKGVRTFSAVFLPLMKGGVLFRFTFIKEHNKLERTGYKFIIGQ